MKKKKKEMYFIVCIFIDAQKNWFNISQQLTVY